MKLIVCLLSGKKSEFEISEESTILELKKQVSSIFEIEENNLFLMYHSNFLTDESRIKDINYIEGSSFIIAGNSLFLDSSNEEANQAKSNSRILKENSDQSTEDYVERLNQRPQKDSKGNVIPWNYNELVTYIRNLGFPIEYTHHALKFTNYDLNRAIYLLKTGKAIGSDGREHSCNIILNAANDVPNSYGVCYPNQNQENTNANSENTSLYVTYDEPEEPEEPEKVVVPIRRTEEEKKLDETMNNFTEEEKLAITRLSAGRDQSIVVQVFIACDKDEILTESCLSTMV